MLEVVLRLHTHDLWDTKTSGVVRNVGILVSGTEGRPRGQLLHMESWLVRAGWWGCRRLGWLAGALFVTAVRTLVRHH